MDDFVVVFMTDKSYEAEIIRGLLLEYGVEAFLYTTARERDMLYPVMKLVDPQPDPHYQILVRPETEEEARQIISAPLLEDIGSDEWEN